MKHQDALALIRAAALAGGELRQALFAFKDTYNTTWLIGRLGASPPRRRATPPAFTRGSSRLGSTRVSHDPGPVQAQAPGKCRTRGVSFANRVAHPRSGSLKTRQPISRPPTLNMLADRLLPPEFDGNVGD